MEEKMENIIREEDNDKIEWQVISKVTKNSYEGLIFYKNENKIVDYNDHYYHGGQSEYTREDVLKSTNNYRQRNIEFHFGKEILEEILLLVS